MSAKYICDDGQNVCKYIAKNSQDLLFSCPPYYDIEVYSDDPRDASNQHSYSDFIKILDNAFSSALQCLRDDRFACIVVGDIRDGNGYYRNFTNDIIRLFKRNGLGLYNELIIVEPIGTLPQRVGRYMRSRKVGKCHQNVLVFYKGNTNNIKNNFKEILYESEDLERFEVDFGDRTE
jgi:DNA modification methylase